MFTKTITDSTLHYFSGYYYKLTYYKKVAPNGAKTVYMAFILVPIKNTQA
ncbi:MAG: hypothetical protein GX762_02205 [Bacteroidales bacterium]|nr:hypothetical protein [Bacteroidales bacterium]